MISILLFARLLWDFVRDTADDARLFGWRANTVTFIAILWMVFLLATTAGATSILSDLLAVRGISFNRIERYLCLGAALLVASLGFPLVRQRIGGKIPWSDWVMATVGFLTCMYLAGFSEEISRRLGKPNVPDLVIASLGLLLLALAWYRALGALFVGIAAPFVLYTFFGSEDWVPEDYKWKGASYQIIVSHFWLTTEGVFDYTFQRYARLLPYLFLGTIFVNIILGRTRVSLFTAARVVTQATLATALSSFIIGAIALTGAVRFWPYDTSYLLFLLRWMQ